MSVIVLVSPLSRQVPLLEGADYAGVDAGALCCMRQGIPMVFAIGDFDTAGTEKTRIALSTECHVLPCRKNETDMESALLEAKARGYDTIILYGVLQGRFDHTMANLYLLLHRGPAIWLMDEKNRVRIIGKGVYHIRKEYRYLSFLALEDSCISESGVSYPLTRRQISVQDIYTISNEITASSARIEVHSGRLLMMECDDQHE